MGYTDENNEEEDDLTFDMPWAPKKEEPVMDDTDPDAYIDKSTVAPIEKIISGTGITDSSVSKDENEKLLSSLNAGNDEMLRQQALRDEETRKKAEEEEETARQKQMSELLKERFLREQEEKAKREEEERIREEEEAKEAEERRQNNPFLKFGQSAIQTLGQIKDNTKLKAEAKAEEKESAKHNVKDKETEKAEKAAQKEEARKKAEEEKASRLEARKADKEAKEIEKASEKTAKGEKKSATTEEDTSEKKGFFGFGRSGEKPVKENKSKTTVEKTKPVKQDYKYLATHDKVTGLCNGVALDEVISPPFKSTVVFSVKVAEFEEIRAKGFETEKAILTHLTGMLERNVKENIYYLDNGEFILLINETEKETQNSLLSSFSGGLKEITYTLQTGFVPFEGSIAESVEEAKKDRIEKVKEKEAKDAEKSVSERTALEYDSLLSSDQRDLKETVQMNHSVASREATIQIVRELQGRQAEVLAILIAAPNFDTLFILRDVSTFVNLIMDMDNLIDYSYLYIVYEGGPQYYGADEYYSKVTHLFEDIAKGILSGRNITAKDITRIKGINIFKNIYFE